jgi:pseudaminic acid synthase
MMGNKYIEIQNRRIGTGHAVYIIAELSANHNQKYSEAVKLIEAAKSAGADAVKLQTYTPDTMTIKCDKAEFLIKGGTLWDGKTLYDLYSEAYMPWDWQSKLKKVADDLQITLFSTPFDTTSVDFLQEINIPAYKIASFEIVDIPLIEYVASKHKPIIISTGMATLDEINECVQAALRAGASQVALLKCTSAYPSSPEEMDLQTIPSMSKRFGIPIGLSDHTLGIAVPVAAVVLGACIVEKHFTLSRGIYGPDSTFSLEPNEFKSMVDAIRTAEKALGEVSYQVSNQEAKSRVFRRSLFVVKDIKKGDVFNKENVRSIRPGYGLHPRYYVEVLGAEATQDIIRGTPLTWAMISK